MWLINIDTGRGGVLLRPDSEYAMSVAIGDATLNKNKELGGLTIRLYKTLLRQRGGQVRWSHVKGHSEHKWNDVADQLADEGSQLENGETGCGGNWTRSRLDGGIPEHQAVNWTEATVEYHVERTGDSVRVETEVTRTGEKHQHSVTTLDPTNDSNHITRRENEATRILRATDHFGTLNLLPKIVWTDTAIAEAAIKAGKLMKEETDREPETASGKNRWKTATNKLKGAKEALATRQKRDKVARGINEGTPHITHTKMIPV